MSDSTEKNEGAAYVSYIRYVRRTAGTVALQRARRPTVIGDCSGLQKGGQFCGGSTAMPNVERLLTEANGGISPGLSSASSFLALAITGCAHLQVLLLQKHLYPQQ